MNRPEQFIRLIFWLGKRQAGLALLLALATFVALVALPIPAVESAFEGRAFRAGVYIGTLVFPNYAARGTNGFYLVPLFGAAANFLVLMAFWYAVIMIVQWMRRGTSESQS